MSLRKNIYRIITFTLFYSKLIWIINYFLPHNGRGLILGYHRVTNKNDFLPNGLTISEKLFSKQLKLLTKYFAPQQLENLVTRREHLHSSKLNICITIDDGYKDIYENALPILNKYNIPFTIFICTGLVEVKRLLPLHQLYYIFHNNNKLDLVNKLSNVQEYRLILQGLLDQPEKFMRTLERFLGFQLNSKKGENFVHLLGYGSYKYNPSNSIYLSWDNIRKIRLSGNSIGLHTHNHPRLGCLSKREQETEIQESLLAFKSNLNFNPTEFAYPFGDKASYNQDTIEVLKDLKFKLACTTENGFYSRNDNNFILKRKMDLNKPIDVFAFEVLGLDLYLRSCYKKNINLFNSFIGFMPIGQHMRYSYIFKYLRSISAGSILEIGASSPIYLKKLSKNYQKSEIVGVDIIQDNIDFINKKNIKNVKYYLEDMQNPSKNIIYRKFNLVICSDVLAHVHDDRKLLKNIFNIMNNNGSLLIHTPTKEWKRIFKEFNNLGTHTFDMVRQGYEYEEIYKILKEIGFQDISIKYTSKILGKLAWEFEQKANKHRFLTKLIFPLLKALVYFDPYFGRTGNGLMLECKKIN